MRKSKVQRIIDGLGGAIITIKDQEVEIVNTQTGEVIIMPVKSYNKWTSTYIISLFGRQKWWPIK